jgi:hypothetical protein
MRDAHAIRHQKIERLNEVRHIATPHRLRGTRDFEALLYAAFTVANKNRD